jgi:hypothetical protein
MRPVVTGFCISIGLLIFISIFDFQPATKKPKQHPLKLSPTVDGRVCFSDGNCPVRSTCSVVANKFGAGTCEPFLVKHGPEAEKSCVDTCLKELRKDEHFYHESWPVVEWTESIVSQGRPDGCAIVYRREPEGPLEKHWQSLIQQDKKPSPEPGVENSILNWVHERFHHVKRVDPASEDVQDDKWVAYCTNPCQTDADCATPNDGKIPGFVCREGTCLRNPDYFTEKQEMVIVTGATSSYYRGLVNLAASARHFAPHLKMVVYNLGGMDEVQKKTIRSWSNVLSLEWPDGVPSEYPEHVSVGKKYAWKPVIVKEALEKYGSIFWLDAGSTLTGKVDMARDIVEQHGIMLVKGQDLDMHLSHEQAYKWFGYDKATLKTGPHFSGNTQAFLYPSRYFDTVVAPNEKCALDISCIAPEGSNLGNHRYDQTTLSILGYSPKLKLPHFTEILAAQRKQVNEDLAKPSFRFVWTARQGCHFYAELDAESKNDPMFRASPREYYHREEGWGGVGHRDTHREGIVDHHIQNLKHDQRDRGRQVLRDRLRRERRAHEQRR